MTFDRTSDYEQGREDALNGFPRASTRPYYRAGYDKGLSDSLRGRRTVDAPERKER